MEANIYPISHHDSFDHGCQITICFHIIASNSLYKFISILVPIFQHYLWLHFPWDPLFRPSGFDSRWSNSCPLIHHVRLWCSPWDLVNVKVIFNGYSLILSCPSHLRVSRRL